LRLKSFPLFKSQHEDDLEQLVDQSKRINVTSNSDLFLDHQKVIILLEGNLILDTTQRLGQLIEISPGEVLGPFPQLNVFPEVKLVSSQITIKPSVLVIPKTNFVALFHHTKLMETCKERAKGIIDLAKNKIAQTNEEIKFENEIRELAEIVNNNVDVQEILKNPKKVRALYKSNVLSDYPNKVRFIQNLGQRVKDLVSTMPGQHFDSSGLEYIRMNRRDDKAQKKDALDIIHAIFYMRKANEKVSKKVNTLLKHNQRLQLIDNPAIPQELLYEYLMRFSIYLGKSKRKQLEEALKSGNIVGKDSESWDPIQTKRKPTSDSNGFEALDVDNHNKQTLSDRMKFAPSMQGSFAGRPKLRKGFASFRWHAPEKVPAPTSKHYHEAVNQKILQSSQSRNKASSSLDSRVVTGLDPEEVTLSTHIGLQKKLFSIKNTNNHNNTSAFTTTRPGFFLTNQYFTGPVSKQPYTDRSTRTPANYMKNPLSKSLTREMFEEKTESNQTQIAGGTISDETFKAQKAKDTRTFSFSSCSKQILENHAGQEYNARNNALKPERFRSIVALGIFSSEFKPAINLRQSGKSYLEDSKQCLRQTFQRTSATKQTEHSTSGVC
jgi:hypothetical protein